MDFRLNAHDPRTGDFLYTLPRPAEVQIGDVFGDRGTLELTYSTHQARAVAMPTFLEVQAQVQFDGGAWDDVGPALIRLGGSHEDTDRADMRKVQFVGRDWLLGRARVGAGDLPLIDGKRPFYQATAGQILRSLILEAQDRGAADGIELGPFTNTTDSAGNAWTEQVTIYYSPGLPIGDVLANLVEQGVCDYLMEGRTLHVYEPETTLGRDLTTGDNPVRVHGSVTEAPVKYSLEDLANSALLIGEDGFQVEVDNPSAPDDYGRLEITIEQGGVNQEGTARTLIDAELQRGSREVREITRTQHAAGARFLPYRDYRPGDFAQAFDDGQWERYRVREIQLVRDASGWTVHTVLNDRLKELLLKLAEKTNGITNGSRGSGGDGTQPAPPQRPGVEPAAPEGLVIDQQVYLDDSGTARGVITAGWGEVTESTAGLAIDIGGYELWWRENTTYATWTRATATSGDTTVDQSPVILTASDGSAMEYQWRVRAVAQASNRPGPWSNTVTLTMTQDTTPPPPPSAPIVSTGFRIVTVEWDGVDENGQDMPRDFSRVRVYLAPAEDMAGARLSGSLAYPGSWNSETMPADVPVWVALTAVDRVGNESAMTPAVSVTPRQLVDDEQIREELDGLEGTIQDAYDELHQDIENIVVDANGNATFWLPEEPDETTEPTPKTGDIWFNTSDGNKLHRFDGQGWVSASDSRFDTIQDAYDDLSAEVDTVRTSVNGKNRITQSVDAPPTEYDGAVGDRWERMSSMGSGGRMISNWSWNGDVWVSSLLSDAVIANLDAAKINTGFLDAARLEAGSVQASSIAVGDFTNYATIDPVRDINVTRPFEWSTVTEGDYTVPAPGSQNYLMFKDRTDTVPLKGGESLRAEFRAIAASPSQARVRIWAYPAASDGSSGGSRVAQSEILTLGTTDQAYSIEIPVPESFNDTVLRSWILGLLPGSGTDAHDIGIREVRVTRMTGRTLIQDGAITTDKIAVGAITAESGVVGSLDAGIISVGELDAARIGANSITADKLLVGENGNRVPFTPGSSVIPYDDYFTGTQIQTLTHATGGAGYCFVGGNGADGVMSNCANLTATNAAEAGTVGAMTVSPGEFISARARFGISGVGGTPAAGANVRAARITTAQYDVNGDYISGTTVHGNTVTDLPWYEGPWSEIQVEVNASARSMRVLVQKALWSSGSIFMSALEVRDVLGATLIQDGAITTDKILANAITAGKIAALAIEADHISANAITADKINAGAIDGKIITGATVRTNESGARVQMNPTGLYAYNPSNEQTFSINANTGAVGITGNLTQRNSYGSLQVGPSLFNVSDGGNGSPAITLREAGSTVWGPAGILLKESGTDQTLNIQGPLAASGQGAYLALPVHGSSRSVGIRRMFGDGDHSYLALSQDRGVHLQSSGGNAYLSSRHATLDYSRAYVSTSSDGQITLRTQQTSKSSVRGGYINLDTNGVVVTAGNGASGVVARNLYLNAYGTARFQSFPTGSSGSAKSYIRAENNGEITIAGDGGGIYYRLTSDGWHRASGIYGQSVIEPVQGMTIDNTGKIGRYGSSRRWKTAIETISTDDYEDALLSVEYKSWIYTKTQERSEELRQYRADNPMAPIPEHLAAAQDDPARQTGMIAEELHDAGVTELVGYDQYGRPDSIIRENFGMALVPIIKRLRDRVDALETQLGATE